MKIGRPKLPDEKDGLLTATGVAARLGCNGEHVMYLLRRGVLKRQRGTGDNYRYLTTDVDKLAAAKTKFGDEGEYLTAQQVCGRLNIQHNVVAALARFDVLPAYLSWAGHTYRRYRIADVEKLLAAERRQVKE